MTFKEGQLDTDGFNIRYWEAGKGRPVVMLDQTGWRESLLHDALAETYRVFSIELPGTGDSPVNTRSNSIADLAAAAAATGLWSGGTRTSIEQGRFVARRFGLAVPFRRFRCIRHCSSPPK